MNLEPQGGNRNIVHTRIRGRIQLAGAIVAVWALASACERSLPPVEGAPRSVVADIIVSVSNRTSQPMLISLRTGATEHPLGAVPERSARSFALPSGLGSGTGVLRFEARALRAATGIHSDEFSLLPGQQVLWAFDESGSRAVLTR